MITCAWDGVGFCLPPKSAGSSIKAAILKQMNRPLPMAYKRTGGVNRPGVFEAPPSVRECRMVVAAIRHPVARFRSACREKSAVLGYPREPRQCLAHVRSLDVLAIDVHFRPQQWFYAGLTVDYWLRVSSLNDDWFALEHLAGWPHRGIPHLNRSDH